MSIITLLETIKIFPHQFLAKEVLKFIIVYSDTLTEFELAVVEKVYKKDEFLQEPYRKQFDLVFEKLYALPLEYWQAENKNKAKKRLVMQVY